MLPRALSKKTRTNVTGPPQPTSSEPQEPPGPSTSTSTSPQDSTEQQHLDTAALIWDIETLMSDYGLSRHPDLLSRVRSSSDGCSIHLSTLALAPTLAKYQFTVPALKQVLIDCPPTNCVLVTDANVLKREALAADVESAPWPDRCFYAENLPPLSNDSTSPAQVRHFLSQVLHTVVQTVHFPLVVLQPENPQHVPPESSLSFSQKRTFANKDEKAKDVASRLPAGGGPYKRFAFFVVRDDPAVERIKRSWGWNRKLDQVDASLEADDEEGDSDHEHDPDPKAKKKASGPLEQAQMHGLRILPLADWRRLRQEYQEYSDRLQALVDVDPGQPQSHSSAARMGLDSIHNIDNDLPQPGRADAATDWRQDRIQQEEEQREEDYPRGCVVFIKNVNPQATRGTLRSLGQACMRARGDQESEVLFVNYEKGMSSATMRCSSSAGATALQQFLEDNLMIMMDPSADSPSRLTPENDPVALEATFDILEPELLSGRKEANYWADVPVHARTQQPKGIAKKEGSGSMNSKKRRRQQEKQTEPEQQKQQQQPAEQGGDETKHIRFDE